jgi:hypothetical protein
MKGGRAPFGLEERGMDVLRYFSAVVIATICTATAGYAQTATPASQRTLLDKYCVTCHSEKLRTGGMTLEKIDTANVPAGAETWEKVVRKLRAGSMPPPGMPRPDQAAAEGFVASLETSLDRAALARPNPGRATVHRLNRTEYANAVRDLLALDIDAASLLPADDENYGFDNIADVLKMSPALMERYLAASRKVSRLAGAILRSPQIPRPIAPSPTWGKTCT